MSLFFAIVLSSSLLFAIGFIVLYNALVKGKNKLNEAWSGIEVQLKRRYDLIPNLVAVVERFSAHEVEIMGSIENLKKEALAHDSVPGRATSENQLFNTLNKVIGTVNDAPEAQADTQFLKLQETLFEIEDHLQKARRYYNALVRDHNHRCTLFPSAIVAALLNIKKEAFFDAEGTAQDSPQVDLSS